MIIGYARTSSSTQNLNRQIQQLEEFGCKYIYTDQLSGKDFKRSGYQEMKNFIRSEDILVIPSLSRLGRTKKGLLQEWRELTNKNINIVVLDMPILDTRKYEDLEGVGQLVTDIVLQLLSWMVEEERKNIRENQRQGIELAKQQGKYTGRKMKYHANAKGQDKLVYDEIIKLLKQKKSVMDIHRDTDVSRNTIYRIKREREQELANIPPIATIYMWLRVENNSKFVRGKKKVREDIESFLRFEYNMNQLSSWEYEFYVPYENLEDLENKVYDIIEQLHFEADLKNCFIEEITNCDELNINW